MPTVKFTMFFYRRLFKSKKIVKNYSVLFRGFKSQRPLSQVISLNSGFIRSPCCFDNSTHYTISSLTAIVSDLSDYRHEPQL